MRSLVKPVAVSVFCLLMLLFGSVAPARLGAQAGAPPTPTSTRRSSVA